VLPREPSDLSPIKQQCACPSASPTSLCAMLPECHTNLTTATNSHPTTTHNLARAAYVPRQGGIAAC
jgi:hypothetical protein